MSTPGPTQFDYAVAPAQVAVGADPVTLTITATNNTGADVACTMIRFPFPAAQLGTAIQATSDAGTWQIVPSDDVANAFDATPISPAVGIGRAQSVAFEFTGIAASTTPGPATIQVLEATDAGVGEQDITVELLSTELSITAFTVTSVFVTPGTEVTFAWDTLGADSVTLDWQEGTCDGGPTGTCAAQPTATVTATLTAIQSGSSPVSAQLVVTVANPQILSFATDPSPAQIAQGQTVLLSWETLFAEQCTLSFTPYGELAGASDEVPTASPTEGYPVTPVTGSYELQAIGNGNTVPAFQNVTVEPVQAAIAASKSPLAVGESATLRWETQWATSVTIDPDLGIGAPPPSGSAEVAPLSDTTYTLTPVGLDAAAATATVAVAPLVTSLIVGWNGNADLMVEWRSNAAQAVLSGVPEAGTYGGSDLIIVGSPPGVWRGVLTFSSALGATATVVVNAALDVAGVPESQSSVAFAPADGAALNAAGAQVAVSWEYAELGEGRAGYDGQVVDISASPTTFAASPTPAASPAWWSVLTFASDEVTVTVIMGDPDDA